MKYECRKCGAAVKHTYPSCNDCGQKRHTGFTTSRAFAGTSSLGEIPIGKHINQHVAASGKKVVMALAGGGYGVTGKLMRPGGLSSTILECVNIVGEDAFIAFNRGRPDKFVSSEAARTLAMASYKRCLAYASEDEAVGISVTASLRRASWEEERQEREHLFFVAVQTSEDTAVHYTKLTNDGRSRIVQEAVLEDSIYRIFLDAMENADLYDIDLGAPSIKPTDTIWSEGTRLGDFEHIAYRDMYEVVHGRLATTKGMYEPKALFSSSLNPIHEGHVAIINRAAEELKCPVDVELCVVNADKPALDYLSIMQRIEHTLSVLKDNPNFGRIIVSNTSRFFDKCVCYSDTTFVVGEDTLTRINQSKYYKNGILDITTGLHDMKTMGNRFLVFPRQGESSGNSQWNFLKDVCNFVQDFKPLDISSTAIRKSLSNV